LDQNATKIEGKINVEGAEESYLLSLEEVDYISKTAVAFKGNTAYRLYYVIYNGDNEELRNTVEQYFSYMLESYAIE
jgi:hypothetical protein